MRAPKCLADEFGLRLAVAVALTFASPVRRLADGELIDAVKRFKTLNKWRADKLIFPCAELCTADKVGWCGVRARLNRLGR